MFPEVIQQKIIQILTSKQQKEVRIFASHPLSGGDINSAVRIETTIGNFFVKWNQANTYPEMFEKEAKGLQLLQSLGQLRIPQVKFVDSAGGYSFLVLEYLEQAPHETNFWQNFGRGLAKLHKNSVNYFGLDHDNYIGSLPQSNRKKNNWIDFLIEERLNFQLRLARDSHLVDSTILSASERLFKRLNESIPVEPSALLHGDLWSGNFRIGNNGEACLIDPAVYYAHREMDIAMTKLFGGFNVSFYEAYNQEFPLEKGWEQRLDICNLYPLLVHVNLFGGSYISQVSSILKRF